MHGLCHISGFVVLVAFLVGGAGCSDDQAQQVAGGAVGGSSESETKPAEGQAEPTEEGETEGEVVEIPLDQIWAYKMPGTRDILALQSDQITKNSTPLSPDEQRHFIEKRLWTPIAMFLMADSLDWPREDQKARSGFAVLGTDLEALQEVHAVLVEGEKPQESFPVGRDVTLAFFSYQFEAYVHLRRVERRADVIDIEYRFVAPLDKISSVQLALIPLKNLPIGEYRVRIKQMPPVLESRDGGYETLPPELRNQRKETESGDRFVCGAFSFRVADNPKNR